MIFELVRPTMFFVYQVDFCRFKVRTESLSSRSLCVKSSNVSKKGQTSSLDTGAPGFLFGAFVEVFVRDDVRIKDS